MGRLFVRYLPQRESGDRPKYLHSVLLCLFISGSRVSESLGAIMNPSHRLFALRTSVRLTLATLSLVTVSAYGAEALDTVTVTANRMPTENALAPTTLITRTDIERLQITDLPTLLSRQPGISVSVSGGLGKQSSIFMRGTNSDHVLVLVDGIKWQSATSGAAAIQNFPVEQIERIEIVRGPRSGLYGAEAIGGVIQIFTRQGKQGLTPYGKITYGSHNSKQIAAGLTGGDEKTSYNVSFNHDSTDGINAHQNDNPDNDGYRSRSLSAKIQHQLTDKIDIGANVIRSEGFNDYDGFNVTADNKSELVEQVLGINSQVQISQIWLASMNLGESRDQAHDFVNGTANGAFSTRHRFANLSNTFKLTPEHTINIGFDYDIDQVTSTTNFVETSRDNKALFVSWQGNVAKHSWLLSARHDDNEAYGNNNTGTAEWGYKLDDTLTLTANIGTAFKAPTFNQLYWPTTAFFVGNPDLNPEKSKSYGLGLVATPTWGQWSIQTYKTEVRDLLLYVFPTTKNVNKAKIKGIEFDVATDLLGWDVAANASLLKPEDEQSGNILPRRAQRLANIFVDKQWGAFSAGASVKLRGHSFDNAANTTRLGGYGLLDLRIAYQVTADWTIQAKLDNAFNKRYQTVRDYNSLDRTVMFTLSYQP